MRYPQSLFVSALIFAGAALAQNSTSFGPYGGSASFAPAFAMQAVPGAPYSGEEIDEQVQTLADGTHITHTSLPVKVYRDSQGRTRRERQIGGGMMMASHVSDTPVIVEITDPVAQVKYTLDTVNKVAHRQQMAARQGSMGTLSFGRAVGAEIGGGSGTGSASSSAVAPPPPPPPPAARLAGGVRPESTTEKLGTDTIEGVLVEGTRHTTTWPVGAQGNDRPISNVMEKWMSADLKLLISSKTTDPRNGEHTHKLTSISRAEPSPDLFQPPSDYTVVDETGNFTIKWGSPQ
jgi:hypothetical protein